MAKVPFESGDFRPPGTGKPVETVHFETGASTIELPSVKISTIVHLLQEMGYRDTKVDRVILTLQRTSWPGKEFTANPVDFRYYLVELREVGSGVHMKFYDPKLEHQFDGRQIAYKAAQEFLLKSNLAVNS